MATTTDLCKVMADALGIERDVVLDHARHLHEAGGMFPTDDDTAATPEHAGALLISLMSGLSASQARDALLLYGGLPLESARRGAARADGSWVTTTVPDGDPFKDDLLAWGHTYGEFLTTLIAWWNDTTEANFEVMHFIMGGGQGAASASIYFGAFVEGENIAGDVKFSFGTDTFSHDGPRARLEKSAFVSGAILPIIRQVLTDNEDGPKEVFMSCAEFMRLGGGGEA